MSPQTVQGIISDSPGALTDKEIGFRVRTGDGSINLKDVRLFSQQLGSLLQNPQSLLLSQSTLSIKVIFQECDVWFCAILSAISKKLFWCWLGHRRGLNLVIRVQE